MGQHITLLVDDRRMALFTKGNLLAKIDEISGSQATDYIFAIEEPDDMDDIAAA